MLRPVGLLVQLIFVFLVIHNISTSLDLSELAGEIPQAFKYLYVFTFMLSTCHLRILIARVLWS